MVTTLRPLTARIDDTFMPISMRREATCLPVMENDPADGRFRQ
jgi:hypothetical protein